MERLIIELIFRSADGLNLYRRSDGVFIAQNEHEFLSIVGCIMIDAASDNEDDSFIANSFLERLRNNTVMSIETGKPITVKW